MGGRMNRRTERMKETTRRIKGRRGGIREGKEE